jgi:hypothetical protein
MRSLAQPHVLVRAGLAALVTSLICCPRLALWTDRTGSVFFLWLILLWAMFILWAFVFAWQSKYAHRPAINFQFPPELWAGATLYALALAVVNYHYDPQLHAIVPGDYPANLDAWVAMTLFALALEPLFFCFAPYALFIRLARRADLAAILTVLFGIFVVGLRLNIAHPPVPFWFAAQAIFLRAVAGFVSIYFYLRGGAFVIWWMRLIVQVHFLAFLAQSR